MSEIGKAELFEDWRRAKEWQDKLYKKAAHKALDIPEDDMEINVSNKGIGPWGGIGIALAAAAVPGALAAWLAIRPQECPPAGKTLPADQEIEIHWHIKDGKMEFDARPVMP